MHILVIEDEPRIRAFLGRALEGEGFAVDGAEDGLDGLSRALEGGYDLVILDLLLPRVDGLTVLRELTRRLPALPVVVVSARSDLSTKLRGFRLGARDYISKPFAFDELVARVRVHLRPAAGSDAPVLRASGVALDLAMVWHARRRQEATKALAREAEQRALLLERQENFLHDVSHELRTPITIARGHLEVAQRSNGSQPEIAVAVDELARMERIVERLLLLAKTQAATLTMTRLELSAMLEEVVMRWSDVAPRVWRVGQLADGTLRADPDALRCALDALVENAVQHTEPTAVIEVSSRASGGEVSIAVADEGSGIPDDAVERIFARFARADAARSRGAGGVGLGLAIVEAIAHAHGGRCAANSSAKGSVFTLVLPGFRAAPGALVPAARALPVAAGDD